MGEPSPCDAKEKGAFLLFATAGPDLLSTGTACCTPGSHVRLCFRLLRLSLLPPNVLSARTSILPRPDIAIAGRERLDPVTGACIKAEFGAISRANCLRDDSDDSVHWFSDYGSNWIEFIGTSGSYHLHRYLLMELNGYSCPVLPGRMCR